MTFQPLPGLSIATLIALVILLSLGTWQLQRRVEKHELLDQMEARKAQAAAPVELLIPVGDYAAFRKATALGEFDHTREAFVSVARTDNGPTEPGFKVLTPFRLTGGDVILVDRGWIPQANRPRATRLKASQQASSNSKVRSESQAWDRPSRHHPTRPTGYFMRATARQLQNFWASRSEQT